MNNSTLSPFESEHNLPPYFDDTDTDWYLDSLYQQGDDWRLRVPDNDDLTQEINMINQFACQMPTLDSFAAFGDDLPDLPDPGMPNWAPGESSPASQPDYEAAPAGYHYTGGGSSASIAPAASHGNAVTDALSGLFKAVTPVGQAAVNKYLGPNAPQFGRSKPTTINVNSGGSGLGNAAPLVIVAVAGIALFMLAGRK